MEPDDDGGLEQDAELRCRICLETEVSEFISLFCVASTQKKLLAHMTLACAGVPISMCDKMPQVICDKCLGNLDIAYACWRRCRESWGDYQRDPALKNDEEDFRCRICLRVDVDELISVYCICDSQLLKINEMIKQYSGVEVKEDDCHPQYMCEGCLSELNIGFEFRKLCRQTNVKLRLELQAKESTSIPVESDSESLPEADRDHHSPTPPAPEPSKVQLKKIAQRRMSMKKVVAKPELASSVQIARLDIPEVVPSSFKRKTFSSPSEFKELTSQILNKAKPDPPTTAKKATFSSASEFKELASKIISKADKPAPTKPPLSSTLVAFEIRVLTDSEQYTYSEISSFKCSSCNFRNTLQAIGESCSKCCSSFDNYLVVRPHKGKPNMVAYCCTDCNYFCKVLSSMVNHVRQHQPAAAPKQPSMVMRNLIIPLVPVPIEPIAMKEETVEAPEKDDHPDPLEVVLVQGTMNKAANNELKRVIEPPVPEVQSKKPRPNPTSETFDVLIELNQSEVESNSEAESTVPARSSSEEGTVRRSPSRNKTVDTSKEPDMDSVFDTLLEADHYKVLFLKGALCCGCTQLLPSHGALEQHLAQDHDKRRFNVNEITCNTCMTKCRSVDDVGHHQILTAKKIFYFCKICPRILRAEEDFECHRLDHHESLPAVETVSSSAMLVSKTVPSETTPLWTAPLKLTSGKDIMFKPLKETAQYRLLLLQGKLCCHCQLVFPSYEELRKHRAKHHPKPSYRKELTKYQCQHCYENCRGAGRLTEHQMAAARKLFYSCKLCRGLLLFCDFETHRLQLHRTPDVMATDPPLTAQTKLLLVKDG